MGAVLSSSLPGAARPPRAAIDAVLGARGGAVQWQTQAARALYKAARVRALLLTGRADEAGALADREALAAVSTITGVCAPAARALAFAAIAEAYLLTGRLRDAVACAGQVADYAAGADDDRVLFTGHALLAAAFTMNGEVAVGVDQLASARRLVTAHGWQVTSWALTVTTVLTALRRGDVGEIEDAVCAFERSAWDPVQQTIHTLCRCHLYGARGEYERAVSTAQSLVHGAAGSVAPSFLVDHLVAAQALALLQLGDPASVLSVVGERASAPDHPVCLEALAATAHLQLTEPRKALRVTDRCVHRNPHHSPASLASVHVRRAVAYGRLRQTEHADAEFSRATHLAVELGAVSPALGLDLGELAALHQRLRRREPEFARHLAALLPANVSRTAPKPLAFRPPNLTKREALLASWLRTECTLVDIAKALHVSPNTIKTQARSLYRKLGVGSREEAVDLLTQTGLYPAPEGVCEGEG
ncbi:helix-turn-helix transcriptional regulator [Xylanimonas ulmi]|uniref:helix-turn-helix transcriptional regulator n=1 Tax=Xylanimonas ulmi TaxID=228973 RepID=UPI00102B271A|nr:LuxR C-terminal-related transcriptional regulator [Xylanibacterium ulmi]